MPGRAVSWCLGNLAISEIAYLPTARSPMALSICALTADILKPAPPCIGFEISAEIFSLNEAFHAIPRAHIAQAALGQLESLIKYAIPYILDDLGFYPPDLKA